MSPEARSAWARWRTPLAVVGAWWAAQLVLRAAGI